MTVITLPAGRISILVAFNQFESILRFALPRLMAAEGIMAAKESSVKRYVVRLSADERERLEALIRKGKSPAQRLLKARILLKADVSEAGEGWSDSRIIKALETSVSMVYRVRKQLVEEGALRRC